ncbi:MAG: rRNA maturation RNase YbeY [Alphaproteobacteria bacterium]|nr:rRNA maturation RNase YbeY [Alphaproteobacteria bacterium]
MTSLSVSIDSTTVKWKNAFPRMKAKITEAAAYAFTAAKKPAVLKDRDIEIHILLTTNARIKPLNRDWMGKDKPTNVLSFPQFQIKGLKKSDLAHFPDTVELGDVVLAHETIKREAREQGKKLEDHVIHLIVHGVLHLLGYDHMTEKDAKSMEKLECDILDVLGYPDPYHDAASSND